MKAGDLVSIYYTSHIGWGNIIDTTGLITAIYGHKADVVVDGEIEIWDISDLKKMEKDKNEAR
tara:strand:+ start:762 stop:950 length:189 start_codon:yes stop_codon:yes gene_type:complete